MVEQITPQERKKLVEFGVVEAVVIIVLSTFILLVLNYFNLVPLSKIFSGVLGWLPTVDKISQTQKTVPAVSGQLPQTAIPTLKIDKNIKGDIEIVNEYPGYVVSMPSKQKVMDLLSSYNFFGGYYIENGKTADRPLGLVKVHFTQISQKEPFTTVGGKSSITYSFKNYSAGVLDLYINVTKSVLNDAALTPQLRGSYISYILIDVTYKLANSSNLFTKEKEDEMKQLQVKSRDGYFIINKQ